VLYSFAYQRIKLSLSGPLMNKILIAIADDHAMVRTGLSALIDSFGDFKVIIQADNGAHLLEQLESAPKLPDICILDISMPVMNGYDTAKELKRRRPQIKILALTMLDNELALMRMINSGANGYILKGDNSADLERALKEVHQHGAYHSDLISNNLFHSMAGKKIPGLQLSDKELKVLQFICSDHTYVEIGNLTGIPPRSVESYRDSLFEKLGVRSRVGLALFAVKLGLVQLSNIQGKA
jgi:two-component system invasion response regulator UvrY